MNIGKPNMGLEYFAHWPCCTPTLTAITDKEISVKIKKTTKIAGVYLNM